MTIRLLCTFVNLYFLVVLCITLCSDCASSETDFLKSETTSEGFRINSNTVSKDYICNKTRKLIRYISKKAIPSCISSSNVSNKILDAKFQTFTKHTGYIPIKRSYDARLFYFFFESRSSKDDPLVLWLNGGPGGSCAWAVFAANGPFHINDDLSLKWNNFGWDKVSNLLYVDHPIGTGFSYSSDHRDIRKSSVEVSKDLYDFLQGFFEVYPKFLENDFYITGASYVGHIAPLLASRLLEKNKNNGDSHINLKGMAIANGNINPEYKYSSYSDFVYANKLVSKSSYRLLKRFSKECLRLIYLCQTQSSFCKDANDLCDGFYNHVKNVTGNPWPYDYRKYNVYPVIKGHSKIENFLALDHVKKAIGVKNKAYVMFSDDVLNVMAIDNVMNYAGVIPQLLENGIKVLIFDGEYDLICNWLGNFRLMEDMKWSGHDKFLKVKLTSYKIDGKKVGEVKNAGPLTFIKVFDAGHGVVGFQPYVSLQIISNWINS